MTTGTQKVGSHEYNCSCQGSTVTLERMMWVHETYFISEIRSQKNTELEISFLKKMLCAI